MVNISVVTQTYLRPVNFERQLEAINSQTIEPHQVLVGHLKGEKSDQFPSEKLDIIYDQDPGMKAKFITAACVKENTDFICVLDDDVIPGRKALENLINSFEKKPGVYGALGFNIRKDMYDEHCAGREEPPKGQHETIQEVDYVGQAWFFPYHYLEYFFSERPPVDVKSGSDDIWFSFKAWDEENIKSYVPPHPPDDKEMWFAKGMEPVSPDVALCRRYDGFHEERKDLHERCRKRGWKIFH